MQFLVVGYDGTDEGAMDRRLAVRPDHIAMGDELREAGNLWYAAVLKDEDGKMIGSFYTVDFPDRAGLDEWLAREPYVVGNVWQRIEINLCTTRDPWRFNRDESFFEGRQ